MGNIAREQTAFWHTGIKFGTPYDHGILVLFRHRQKLWNIAGVVLAICIDLERVGVTLRMSLV